VVAAYLGVDEDVEVRRHEEHALIRRTTTARRGA
jgi:hypothetical protein